MYGHNELQETLVLPLRRRRETLVSDMQGCSLPQGCFELKGPHQLSPHACKSHERVSLQYVNSDTFC